MFKPLIMENNSYLTAITRTNLSVPSQSLLTKKLIVGRVLDYGCGKGFDVKYLKQRGFDIEGYDPHFFPQKPHGLFDTIICNYVINVVEEEYEHLIIDEIKSFLSENGIAYITVRRDVKVEGYRKKGNGITYQRNVILNFDILEENNKYCIYIISNDGK